MNKKIIIGVVAVVALVLAVGGWYYVMMMSTKKADTNQKTYHVGILAGADIFATITDGFKAQMTKLGYVEGKNVVYDVQSYNGDMAGYKNAAKKFVDEKADLVLSFPTEPTFEVKAAAKAAGLNIPIVFVGDIEGVQLVDSIQKPGGTITGVRIGGIDGAVKSFELLKEVAPLAKRIYLIYDKNYPLTATALTQSRALAKKLDLELVELAAATPDDIIQDVSRRDALADPGVDAILLLPSIIVSIPPTWGPITAFAEKHKLPIAGRGGDAINTGALFVLIPENEEMGALAADEAAKVLQGTPAGSIPVESAVLRLMVNTKQGEAIGMSIPEGFLSKADKIVH